MTAGYIMARVSVRCHSPSKIVRAARSNRQEMTPAESMLWNSLRNRKLEGLKFRKQHPMDPYVLDFFCIEQMLAVEVDGGIHQHSEQMEYDRARTLYLQSKGIRVLRFTNSEVCEDLVGVLEKIMGFLRENPIKSRQ